MTKRTQQAIDNISAFLKAREPGLPDRIMSHQGEDRKFVHLRISDLTALLSFAETIIGSYKPPFRELEGHRPHPDDEVVAWLADWREKYMTDDSALSEAYEAVDAMLDEYRAHAHTGTPLDVEIPEGGKK